MRRRRWIQVEIADDRGIEIGRSYCLFCRVEGLAEIRMAAPLDVIDSFQPGARVAGVDLVLKQNGSVCAESNKRYRSASWNCAKNLARTRTHLNLKRQFGVRRGCVDEQDLRLNLC